MDDQRHSIATFVAGNLVTAQRQVAWIVPRRTIVGHEHDNRLVGDVQPIERLQQIAERLVHTFEHRRVLFLVQIPLFVFVVRQKPPIGFKRRVHRVVRHVQIKRLVVGHRLLDFNDHLACDGLGEINFLAVILFQTGDVPNSPTAAPVCREVVIAVVRARSSHVRTGDVHIKTQIARVGARRPLRTEMPFACVDCAVAAGAQEFRQRRCCETPRGRVPGWLQSVEVPIGGNELFGRARGTLVFP